MRFGKILGVWVIIAGLLFWNGALGIGLLNPLLGRDAGEMMTFFIGMSIVFGVSRRFLISEEQLPLAQVLRISALWSVLTLMFEIGFGWLGGFAGPAAPRYGMWDGSFWPLIVMCVALAPIMSLRRHAVPFGRVTK